MIDCIFIAAHLEDHEDEKKFIIFVVVVENPINTYIYETRARSYAHMLIRFDITLSVVYKKNVIL